MKYTAPPYMYDVLPFAPPGEEWLLTGRWQVVESGFRAVCRRFGYREIRTPVLEQTELFTRSIGEETDIVSKEMFTLEDRGGRSLTLKPEGTAPAVRACLQHGLLSEHGLLKLYYIGQNFRYERGQKGRYRQHQQLGAEVFGSTDAAVDAEVISLAMAFYREIGLRGARLNLNSVGAPQDRGAYIAALRDYVQPYLSDLSPEGQRRFENNPLRMLDTKDERDLSILRDAPRVTDYLDPESAAHFDLVQQYLAELEVPFVLEPRLVRGFDYYTRTLFEIKMGGLGSQDAIGGGGRYDGLVEECGGPPTPGIGFGIGMERCLLALQAEAISLPELVESPLAFIVTAGEPLLVRPAAVRLLGQLRSAGIAADMDYEGRSFKRQLKRADDLGARFSLILGESELGRGIAAVRDQRTKEQREAPLDSIAELLLEADGAFRLTSEK